ncbi:copper amine oxidase domain protein [Kyrpidia tusciae DSM 2912]|uniref:Copper amine oxidase domain protein n=1 Tax=Kyrpidia tusciae (strain DSM 2912 / NBRC 15312 / T2) TaxID=562970 RepID=D5WSD3_KYRT2|nr:copper amine oxidase domain protein [Kyrpidia tusciae DSM 2912]
MNQRQWICICAVASAAVLFATPIASAAGKGGGRSAHISRAFSAKAGQPSGTAANSSAGDAQTGAAQDRTKASDGQSSEDNGETQGQTVSTSGDGQNTEQISGETEQSGQAQGEDQTGDSNHSDPGSSSDSSATPGSDTNPTSLPPGIQRAIQALESNIQKNEGKPGKSVDALRSAVDRLKEWSNQPGTKTDEEADRQAEAALSEAAASDQADPQILTALADIREKLNDAVGAIQALEQALQSQPADQTVLPKLRKLYDVVGKKDIQVFVDGKKPVFDVPPLVRDGRTLVPIRQIAEALGAKVDWNQGTVTIRRGNQSVTLEIGDPSASVNGQNVTLDVPPEVSGGRTLVPLRFVGEAFGMAIDYQDGIVSVHPPAGQNG